MNLSQEQKEKVRPILNREVSEIKKVYAAFTGRKVLLSATEVDKITWGGSSLSVNLSRKQVEGGPEFDWETPVDEEFEKRLQKYYGKPPFGP